MPIDMAGIRADTYSLALGGGALENLVDYQQGDYDYFKQVLSGDASVGFQLGALLSENIITWLTAFEIGLLPKVIVTDASGKYDEEKSMFSNDFLADQHPYLLEAVQLKNALGDAYLTFNLDRNLEAIDPTFCDPGFLPYSNGLASLSVNQTKYVKNLDTGRKVKMKIIREYTDQNIVYDAVLETSSKYTANIKVPDKVDIINPLGKCPVLLLPNLKKASYTFGWSDLHWVIPYFEIFHKTLARGFESQQYSGKPILTVSGIQGDVKSWFQRTFGIDIEKQGTDAVTSKVLTFFKQNKFLALADQVKAEFIESKVPTGKTKEILDIAFQQISRITSVPEFMFGAGMATSEASVREQYAGLKAKILKKHIQLNKSLIELIRWAMVWYTKISRNEETGETLENVGVVGTLEETRQYKIKLIWPEFLGSDGRLKIEALSALANAGAISRFGLLKNFPEYVPNADAEMEQIRSEMQEFGNPAETVPQTSAQKASQERRRKDKSNTNIGDDASSGRKSNG